MTVCLEYLLFIQFQSDGLREEVGIRFPLVCSEELPESWFQQLKDHRDHGCFGDCGLEFPEVYVLLFQEGCYRLLVSLSLRV